jgi:hypothetical protein
MDVVAAPGESAAESFREPRRAVDVGRIGVRPEQDAKWPHRPSPYVGYRCGIEPG